MKILNKKNILSKRLLNTSNNQNILNYKYYYLL